MKKAYLVGFIKLGPKLHVADIDVLTTLPNGEVVELDSAVGESRAECVDVLLNRVRNGPTWSWCKHFPSIGGKL